MWSLYYSISHNANVKMVFKEQFSEKHLVSERFYDSHNHVVIYAALACQLCVCVFIPARICVVRVRFLRLRWSSPARWSCWKGARRGRSTAGTRRRISSSGSVNGGLAGGIHPSFTTQKRKMVDLPHPGLPHAPIAPSLSLSLPLFRVVSCLVSSRKSWSSWPTIVSMSTLSDSFLLHSLNRMCQFQLISV